MNKKLFLTLIALASVVANTISVEWDFASPQNPAPSDTGVFATITPGPL